jgi:hypothetical protein
MYRVFLTLLVFCWTAVGLAEDSSSSKFPSPDGRFALRIAADLKVELIEKASGEVMVDLGTVYSRYLSHPEETVLVWSADSKWAAYATRGNREGDTSVYFWNGSAFEGVSLPDDLPGPEIKFRKGESGGVKNYGGAVKPLRWLKSGGLELSSDLMMLSRGDGRSYTGVVLITLAFDAQHHASVQKVGKTKTKVVE